MDDDGDASPVPLQKEKDNETVESSGSGFQFCLHGMSMFLGALMRVDKMWDWECARVGTNLLRPALVLAPHIFCLLFHNSQKEASHTHDLSVERSREALSFLFEHERRANKNRRQQCGN